MRSEMSRRRSTKASLVGELVHRTMAGAAGCLQPEIENWNVRDALLPEASAIESVTRCRPSGRSTFCADRPLAVITACSMSRRVMLRPSRPYVALKVRMSISRPGPALNRTSIVAGFRTGRDRSGRSRSIVGGAGWSDGSGTSGATLSRSSSSRVRRFQAVCARAGCAVNAKAGATSKVLLFISTPYGPHWAGALNMPLAR
jgi:hypothetical protein